MTILPFLIGIPAAFAVIFPFVRQQKVRGILAYTGAGLVMLTALAFLVKWLQYGARTIVLYPSTELVDHLMIGGDIFLLCLIIYLSVKCNLYA